MIVEDLLMLKNLENDSEEIAVKYKSMYFDIDIVVHDTWTSFYFEDTWENDWLRPNNSFEITLEHDTNEISIINRSFSQESYRNFKFEDLRIVKRRIKNED